MRYGQAAVKKIDPTNRRQQKRHDAVLEVTAEAGHQFFTGFTENISTGGLFIATYRLLPLGSRFRLKFKVPGLDHVFEATCEVRWVREYNELVPDMQPGMGVRFLDLSPEEERLLDEALKKMTTMFYDDEP